MPHLLDTFARVSERTLCPKCGKPDYCLVHHTGRKCICTRVKSGMERTSRQGDRIGWLHYLPDGIAKAVHVDTKPRTYLTSPQVAKYILDHTGDKSNDLIAMHGKRLGLLRKSLQAMQCFYHTDWASLLFPMFDETRHVTGCRLRRADGRKWSLKGGREGVFLSKTFDPAQPTAITEGPTDASAGYQIGFTNMIGRPNCSGGKGIIAGLFKDYPDTPLLILADPDEPGQDGAFSLAETLPNPIVVLKGTTDLREYNYKNLPAKAKRAILEGIRDSEHGTWRYTYKNARGQYFNFLKAFDAK